MTTPIEVIIADDHALFRQGLKSMLRLQPDVTVVAELERASDLLPTLERHRCDVLLLDLQMERNALADIETLAQRVAIVVVTASERTDEATRPSAPGRAGSCSSASRSRR